MRQAKRLALILFCCGAILFGLGVARPGLAGPPTGAVQGPAARATVQGPQAGGPVMVVIGDPDKAAALGLAGLAAGDVVEVTQTGPATWVVKDPRTGRVVESRRQPELSR